MNLTNIIRTEKGTYILVLENQVPDQHKPEKMTVGRWGRLILDALYYLYVGSAFGAGGVRARVLRHFRQNKRLHWHIDYLRQHLTPLGAYISYDASRLEHQWAQAMATLAALTPVPGFGCSDCDCDCDAHLFTTKHKPSIDNLPKIFDVEWEFYPYSRDKDSVLS